MDYGFRTIIAPSYADIFFNNSFKNGLLPIVLHEKIIDELFAETLENDAYTLTVDLQAEQIKRPNGELISFTVDPFRKHCLLNGLDDIGLTLQDSEAIKRFEAGWQEQCPWLFGAIK